MSTKSMSKPQQIAKTLAKLKVNGVTTLPQEDKLSLASAMQALHVTSTKRFCRRTLEDQCIVWRYR